MKTPISTFVIVCLILLAGLAVQAQTSAFSYQGRLNEGGAPPTGVYDFEIRLVNELGAIIGVQQKLNTQVTAGIFGLSLDFGAAAFPGPARSLEIAVRPQGGPPFVTLLPRQPLLSAPYAIRALSATSAAQLGGVDAARYVQSDVGGNVNVNGNLAVSGSVSFAVVNAQTQYNLGGQRLLGIGGQQGGSFFAGIGAGTVNSNTFGGSDNTFVGYFAGALNDSGQLNSFFGYRSGAINVDGQSNAFFGTRAGSKNVSGAQNSFFGSDAGVNNIGNFNSFFGGGSGFANTSGYFNSFFGDASGISNTTGIENSFFGTAAGRTNNGSNNSFFGSNAGRNNTASNNSFFGQASGFANTTGDANAFFGVSTGQQNTTGRENAFFG